MYLLNSPFPRAEVFEALPRGVHARELLCTAVALTHQAQHPLTAPGRWPCAGSPLWPKAVGQRQGDVNAKEDFF